MDLMKVEHIRAGMNVRLNAQDFRYAEVLSNVEAFGDDPVQVCAASPSVPPEVGHTTIVVMVENMVNGFVFPNGHMLEYEQCLEMAMGAGDCMGSLRHDPSFSGTGKMITRCEHHFERRLAEHPEHTGAYPPCAPGWFDEAYAGESWDEEY